MVLFVCLSVSKIYLHDFHEPWWKGAAWPTEESIIFMERIQKLIFTFTNNYRFRHVLAFAPSAGLGAPLALADACALRVLF